MTHAAAADQNAHVITAQIAWEVQDYRANVRTSGDCDDFGDRCYYSDRASDNLDRLRAMGAHDVAFALSHH